MKILDKEITISVELKERLGDMISKYIKQVDSTYLNDIVELEDLKIYFKKEFNKDAFTINPVYVQHFVADIEKEMREHRLYRNSLYKDCKRFFINSGIAQEVDETNQNNSAYGKRKVWFTHGGLDYKFSKWLKK